MNNDYANINLKEAEWVISAMRLSITTFFLGGLVYGLLVHFFGFWRATSIQFFACWLALGLLNYYIAKDDAENGN